MAKVTLPTQNELSLLPKWALVAFAARCARRVYRSNSSQGTVGEAIALAERSSATARAEEIGAAVRAAEATRQAEWDAVLRENDESDYGFEFSAPAEAASLAAQTVQDPDPFKARQTADRANYVFGPEVAVPIRRDFELLKQAASSEGWTNDTPVAPSFFALRTEFPLERPTDRGSIIEITSAIDARLVEFFAHSPERLYGLSPRQFEEIIAELFDGFGFEVELAKRTRDGGRDIVAVKRDIARVKFLVECKLYAPERRVGVRPVRLLHGVVADEKATKGILATTARFTKPARLHFERNHWQLEGRDFDGIVKWLELYEAGRISTEFGVPTRS